MISRSTKSMKWMRSFDDGISALLPFTIFFSFAIALNLSDFCQGLFWTKFMFVSPLFCDFVLNKGFLLLHGNRDRRLWCSFCSGITSLSVFYVLFPCHARLCSDDEAVWFCFFAVASHCVILDE